MSKEDLSKDLPKINITCSRNPLHEGRSTGLAYALLKKIDDNTFETISPFSCCKDYLNDVIYTENTGVTMNACGLKTLPKTGILEEDYIYMGLTCLYTKDSPYSEYNLIYNNKLRRNRTQDLKFLRENLQTVIKPLNEIERLGDLELSTIYSAKCSDDKSEYYIVKLSSYWGKSGVLISLASGLLRLGMQYNDNTNIKDFCMEESKNHNTDIGLMVKILKLIKFIELSIVSVQPFIYMEHQDYEQYKSNPSQYHSLGFQSVF
jgi:hypothetical protein